MITFERNGEKSCTQVQCRVNGALPEIEKSVFLFSFVCGQEYAAALLVRHLNETFLKQVQLIKSEAYERGWKDAKAKRGKQTWFSGYFPKPKG